MVDIKKYSEKDLYEIIGVQNDASDQEIRKAYRKKALDCHPDKNPNNPKAAEIFQELSKVLQILIDKSARSAYDKILNARKAAAIRNRQLDSKRQKLKAELEERERNALSNTQKFYQYNIPKSDEDLLRNEIERLRKEGSKLVQEEQELMKKQLFEEKLKEDHFDSSQYRIKLKWKNNANNELNYNEESLRNYLKKYGDIVAIVISTKKHGSALVEFKTQVAGEMAITYEKGNLLNPLHLEWIGDPPKKKSANLCSSTTITDSDFESLVLRQMRQAEERKQLIEQMMKEEADN